MAELKVCKRKGGMRIAGIAHIINIAAAAVPALMLCGCTQAPEVPGGGCADGGWPFVFSEGRCAGNAANPEYRVTVNGGSGGGTFVVGTMVEITADEAPAGKTFDKWTSTGVTLSSPNSKSVSFAMPPNAVAVTANFKAITYTIDYNLDGGTVTPANRENYTIETESFTLKNPTRDGYTFAGWTGTGITDAAQTVIIANGSMGDRDYIATWTPNSPATYTLTVAVSPTAGGTVSRNPVNDKYEAGMQVTIVATAISGYTFTGWTVTGVSVVNNAGSPSTYVTVNDNATVTANFTQQSVGGSYKTVTIGGKKWMAENLNVETAGSWCYGEGGDVYDYVNSSWKTLTSEEIQANCNKYGRLYTWSAAKSACPSGWHLPSREEWDNLAESAGGRKYGNWGTWHDWYDAGKNLKSKTGWYSNSGTDAYNFSALPGGYRDTDGNFSLAGFSGYWWTAAEHDAFGAYDRDVDYSDDGVLEYASIKAYGLSVRCVAD